MRRLFWRLFPIFFPLFSIACSTTTIKRGDLEVTRTAFLWETSIGEIDYSNQSETFKLHDVKTLSKAQIATLVKALAPLLLLP
jgi:hypothetical protein